MHSAWSPKKYISLNRYQFFPKIDDLKTNNCSPDDDKLKCLKGSLEIEPVTCDGTNLLNIS